MLKKIIYTGFLLLLLGIGGMVYTISTSGEGLLTFSTVEFDESKEIKADKIENIIIDSTSVDVKVIPTNNEDITVELAGRASEKDKKDYQIDTKVDGDTLNVSIEKKGKFTISFFNFTSVKTEIHVPEKLYQSIKLNTNSGDLILEDINANELVIDTDSGDMSIANMTIEKGTKIETASGDLSLINNTFGETLSIKTSSGDVYATDTETDKFSLGVRSGDLSIKDLVANESKIETSSGDISLADVKGDVVLDTGSGDFMLDNSEIYGNITVESSSGDVSIEYGKQPQSLQLSFDSSSGDGYVKLDDMNYKTNKENEIEGTIGDGEFKVTVSTSSGDFTLR